MKQTWFIRSCSCAMLAAACVLLVCSCLKVPLGDPEQSKAEEAFAGAWLWESDGDRNLAVLRPWDERTYYVRWIMLSDDPGEDKAGMVVLKGWLTKVKQETFLTLQDAESIWRLPGEDGTEESYFTMKLSLVDDRLLATSLNPSFPPFEVVRSPNELARLIEQHMENPDMWAANPIDARRATNEEREAFERALSDAIVDNGPPPPGETD